MVVFASISAGIKLVNNITPAAVAVYRYFSFFYRSSK